MNNAFSKGHRPAHAWAVAVISIIAGSMNKTVSSSVSLDDSKAAAGFSYSRGFFKDLVEQALAHAKKLGATDAGADASEGSGLSVSVRKGELETVERNRDKSLGVTVYIGKRRGNASTSDFSAEAVQRTVQAAYDIARFTAEDGMAGLPDPTDIVPAAGQHELDLFHPWAIDSEAAAQLALECEAAAFATDPRITNSEGAGVSAQQSHFYSAHTAGFAGGYASSRHSLSVAPIAGTGADMQRDAWYSSMRRAADLADPAVVGRYAAERSSFLLNSLGKKVFPKHIQLVEDPLIIGGKASAPYDDEGVRVQRRHVVQDGHVQGYFLSTYSARKLSMRTTGNAGGAHNLHFYSTKTCPTDDLKAMLQKLGTGLFVIELMGQGVNPVTGDYSRGASGFWVENGEIAFPVHEITIAGNLRDMFKGIQAVGADEYCAGSRTLGSVLINKMKVAGS